MAISKKNVHIVFGETAWGGLKQVFPSNHLLVLRDPLPYGPVRKFSCLNEFQEMRTKYLEYLFSYPKIRFDNQKYDLLNNLRWIKEFDCIYVWAGLGLGDQLLVSFVIYLVQLLGENPEKIKLVQYETFPNQQFPMHAIGYLNSEQIRLHPNPTPLTKEQIHHYSAGWDAFTNESPEKLFDFCSLNIFPNQHLSHALKHLFSRYPHSDTGLNFWDYQLLTHIHNIHKNGRLASKIIVDLLSIKQDGDFFTDYFLFSRLQHLASRHLNKPLIKLSNMNKHYNDTDVILTGFGKDVVKGIKSYFPINEIDEWVGGVHLLSLSNELWFFKDDKLKYYIE